MSLDDRAGPDSFFFQPDPAKGVFVAAKPEKLVRRGPREYYLVGRKPDGRLVEARLTTARFQFGT
jgi:hypothetical protein